MGKERTKKTREAPAPYERPGKGGKDGKFSLSEATPKNFGIGGNVQPRRNLSRYVKWPRYVRLQRQRRVLQQRLKVPPALNQFTRTLDKNTATALFKFLSKYRPEDKNEKKERMRAIAEAKAAGKEYDRGEKPRVVKFGINHVTALIEMGKAALVVIAHDVDPIELVVWMPALCRKYGVPYCIVKGKARLGKLVHMKTATCACLVADDVRAGDQQEFNSLTSQITSAFNEEPRQVRNKWGGGILGVKSQVAQDKKRKAVEAELASRSKY